MCKKLFPWALGLILAFPLSLSCGSGGDGDGAPDAQTSPLGDAGADAGLDGGTETCTSGPADPAVTDISGTWAWRTVGTRLVSTLGTSFRTRAISTLLATHTQDGTALTVRATYCDRTQVDDEQAPVKVIIPDAWRNTHNLIERSGTFADDGSGLRALRLPRFLELVGVDGLASPETDALPTETSDSRLVDCDNDGNPGLTVGLSGLYTATLYVCQRQFTTMTGYALSPTRIEGQYALESEQSILYPDNLKNTPQTTVPDPAACNSHFVMVKVPEDSTCETLRAQGDALFE